MRGGQGGRRLRPGRTLLAACYFTTILRWIREEPAPVDLHRRLVGALDIILLGILVGEAA